jgi:group I intron endonuclease
MICIIYKLINSVNNKIYIGQTWQTLSRRWRAGIGYKNCIKINAAINKYGKDSFQYEVLTFCGTQDTADYWEDYFIVKYKSATRENGYNLREGGSAGKLSEETKRKLSAAKMGQWHTLETKNKISDTMKGIIFSDEHKAHLSESRKNVKSKPLSEEHKLQISIGLKKIHPGSKLTSKDVESIRAEYSLEKRNGPKLAQKYNVSNSTISSIVHYRNWK